METRAAKGLKGVALIGVATLIASVSGVTFAGASGSAKPALAPATAAASADSAATPSAAAKIASAAHETIMPGLTREQALKDTALHVTDLRSTRPAAASVDSLRAKAVKAGAVPVLVTVAARYAPVGILTATELQSQQASIAELQSEVTKATTPKGAKISYTYDATVPIVAMVATPAALDALRTNPAVARVDEDELDHATLEQSVPQIGAADAHDRGYGGSGWTVAVLDTGADTNHEFLRGATVDEACYSSTSDCPNSFTNELGPGSAVPCTYVVGCNHGTHTAGIAIGLGPSSRPNLQGVANLGLLFPIQVFGKYTGTDCAAAGMDPCALSAASDQIAGLVRVFSQRTAHNIAAVNISIGGGDHSSYCDTDPRKSAIDNLRSAGIATVISAGNDGYIGAVGAPGCISTAITVGAVDKSDGVPQFSNASTMVDVLAPGVDILSSVPGNGYAYMDGTSMAAPHVAGAFAVMKSWTSTLSVDDGESRLESTGKPIVDQSAGGIVTPRINVLKAMDKEMEQIANDQVIDHRNPIPYAHEFMTTSTAHYWSGVAVRPPSTGDVDLTVYDTNVYTGALATSTAAGSTIDFVVQDNNNGRRVLGDLTFPLVSQYTGTGRYQIEYDNQAATIGEGATTIAMGGNEIIEMRDSLQGAGVRNYYRVVPTTSTQDAELFLMQSTAGTSSSYVQARSAAVASSSSGGPGVGEFVNYASPVDQFEGLVLLNKAGSGNYTVYKDSSAPTGSVSINNNAAATNSRNVTLNLSATDSQTQIQGVRYSFTSAANVAAQPWVAYSATKSVVLPAGAGNKTVWVQYRNNAFGPSAVFTDTIKLNTAVTPGAATIVEGNTGTKVLNIPVTLTESSTQTVTAHWQTADHSAVTPADYVAASGTVTFAPGQTSKTVPVTIKGDALDEADENFYVGFSAPTNAVIGGAFGIGVGTITDDDPTPVIAPGSATTTEGNAGTKVINLTVTLSHASGRTVTANWVTHNDTAIAPGDYTAASGTVTFAPGQVTRTIALTIKGDTAVEPNERFYVQLTGPTNATIGGFAGLAPIMVNNDD